MSRLDQVSACLFNSCSTTKIHSGSPGCQDILGPEAKRAVRSCRLLGFRLRLEEPKNQAVPERTPTHEHTLLFCAFHHLLPGLRKVLSGVTVGRAGRAPSAPQRETFEILSGSPSMYPTLKERSHAVAFHLNLRSELSRTATRHHARICCNFDL